MLEKTLTNTFKVEAPKALATLIRLVGDFDLAEDVLQDALEIAVKKWPQNGIPEHPAAWLVSTAKFKSISRFRRKTVEQKYVQSRQVEQQGEMKNAEEEMSHSHFNDDLLRLIFTCCHPSLSIEFQLALTLKTVVGLSTEEIARAFLVKTRAMDQRLVRAKRKIKQTNIPYEIPGPKQLAERLDAVLWVIYLIFNEGYTTTQGDHLIRQELCSEAIRLTRLVHRLFRGEPEVIGLLSLLLLQDARREARIDSAGILIPLEEQNRSLWEQAQINEGSQLVEKALRMKHPGPYQLQAAIAALHNEAKVASETDWLQISLLYFELEKYLPTPIVRMNRAIAVSMEEGPETGLRLLENLSSESELQSYHLYHASLGALLQKVNRSDKAKQAYEMALELTKNPAEQAYLQKRLHELC